jgi:hypothetical protein
MEDLEHKPLDPRELIVSNNVKQHRINVCKSCEYYTKIKFCSLCKCFMPAKTWLSIADCPVKKWNQNN